VRQLQSEIDSREFAEWLAFNEIEPFGDPMKDLRMGILASTVANSAGNEKAPADFIPDYVGKGLTPRKTPEELAERIARAFGGKA